MKTALHVQVKILYDPYLSNKDLREEVLRAEQRANQGSRVRFHFEMPDDIKHDGDAGDRLGE